MQTRRTSTRTARQRARRTSHEGREPERRRNHAQAPQGCQRESSRRRASAAEEPRERTRMTEARREATWDEPIEGHARGELQEATQPAQLRKRQHAQNAEKQRTTYQHEHTGPSRRNTTNKARDHRRRDYTSSFAAYSARTKKRVLKQAEGVKRTALTRPDLPTTGAAGEMGRSRTT